MAVASERAPASEEAKEKAEGGGGERTHLFGYQDTPRAWMRASGRNAQRRYAAKRRYVPVQATKP